MFKKVLVACSSGYGDYEQAEKYIELCISKIRKRYTLIFVSADFGESNNICERFAAVNNFKFEGYHAVNEYPSDAADYFICFWDGSCDKAEALIENVTATGKPLKIKMI